MRSTGNIAGSGGFTFVEVIVATLVFAAAVVGVIAFQKASIVGNEIARDRTVAVNLARYLQTELANESVSYVEALDFDNTPLLGEGYNAGNAMWINFSGYEQTHRITDFLRHTGQQNQDDARFCLHYRVRWNTQISDGPDEYFNTDVRVSWWKPGHIPINWTECATLFTMNDNRDILATDLYSLTLSQTLFIHPRE